MSYFFYVSHTDPIEAFTVARDLMKHGHYPFVPQLNKLISGRSDEQWENYFKMWLFRCDAIYLTKSFRSHERDWAESNAIPPVFTIEGANGLCLPPFIGVGQEFGKELARHLPLDEGWRAQTKGEAIKALEQVAGLGAKPLKVASLALQAWDRQRRNP